MNYRTFCDWRRRIAPQGWLSNGFVEVVATEAVSRIGGAKIRVLIGEVTVELESPIDEAGVVAVLRAVERRAC